jgi:hypothetical protein
MFIDQILCCQVGAQREWQKTGLQTHRLSLRESDPFQVPQRRTDFYLQHDRNVCDGVDPATEQNATAWVQWRADDAKAVVGAFHTAFELGTADEGASAPMALHIPVGRQVGDGTADRAAAHSIVQAEFFFGRQLEAGRPTPRTQVEEQVLLDLVVQGNGRPRLEPVKAGRDGLLGAHTVTCFEHILFEQLDK